MPVPEPYDSFSFWEQVKPYTEWPATDEDAVRTLARAWLDAGAAFTAGGNSAGDNLKDGWTDAVGQEYKRTVDQLRADSGAAGAAMSLQGTLTEAYADDVLNAKQKIAAHIQRYAPIYARLSFWEGAGGPAGVRFVENEAAILNTFLDQVASAIAVRGAGGPAQPKIPPGLTTADDPDSYVPALPVLDKDFVGAVREQTVADLVGGTVLGAAGRPGLDVTSFDGQRTRGTDVDVLGPNGEFIAVGGAHKEHDFRRGTLAVKLTVLQDAAVRQGTHAEAWFTRDTPAAVIEQAQGILGPANVHLFDD